MTRRSDPPSGDRWLVQLEFAEGTISFNPQPTARNLNKPARLLPGCEANPHGRLRDPESKFLETKTRAAIAESSQTPGNQGISVLPFDLSLLPFPFSI
jgi:hypothetical protein